MYPGGNCCKLLLHAVGICGNWLGKMTVHIKQRGVFFYALLSGGGVKSEYIGNKVKVFYARHIFIQVGIVRNVGDIAFALQRLRFYGMTVYKYFAAVKLQYSGNGFQGGGFPAPLCPIKPYISPGAICRQRSSTAFLFAVAFCQIFYFQHCFLLRVKLKKSRDLPEGR